MENLLRKLGVDPSGASLCVRSAIMMRHITITGDEEDLKKVVAKASVF